MEIAFTGFFWTDRWYNVWQLDRTDGVLFYANVAMPCQFDGDVLRWVDLDIDVVCHADGSIVVKDEREFEEHTLLLAYPEDVVRSALAARDELLCLAHAGQFPFIRTRCHAAILNMVSVSKFSPLFRCQFPTTRSCRIQEIPFH